MPRRFRLTNPKLPGQRKAIPKPKIRQKITPVWIAEALARADEILSAPPAKPHLVRVTPVGKLVQRFAVPLELLPTSNSTRHQKPWLLAQMKERLGALMFAQSGGKRREILPGRPMVRCIRFSTVEPDKYSDGFKLAVDKLCVQKNGLGFIRDDRPMDVDLHQAWEYAPKGKGFGLIEVWTGAEAARRTA